MKECIPVSAVRPIVGEKFRVPKPIGNGFRLNFRIGQIYFQEITQSITMRTDHIRISEIGGKGFDPAQAAEKGNGLYNCNKRMASINGKLTYEKTNEAMQILITAPLNPSSNE